MVSEVDLYPDIKKWLTDYLSHKYKGYEVEVTFDGSKYYFDKVLRDRGIDYPEAKGLQIKVDIIGILRKKEDLKFVFVEVKDVPLTLKDLGQLWGYTQLINPVESFLVSSSGLGRLSHIFGVLRRVDVLHYGRRQEKSMVVAKWDVDRKTIDHTSAIPPIN